MIKRIESGIKNMGSIFIIFDKGANIEDEERFRGMSHILEHCLCEKLMKNRNKYKVNGVDFNACTSEKKIIFHLSGFANKVNRYMKEFIESVLNQEITEDIFNKEKLIVEQENKGLITDPDNIIYYNFKKKFYNNYSTIGEVDNIKNLKYEDFIEFKERYFKKPDRICMLLPKRIKTIFDKGYTVEFNNKENDKKVEFKYIDEEENKEHHEKIKLYDIPDNNMKSVYMYFNFKNDEDLKRQTYYIMLKEILPLFEVIRERKKLVYWIDTDLMEQGREEIDFIISTMIDKHKIEKLEKEINKVYKKLCDKKINKTTFNSKKKELLNVEKMSKLLNYNSPHVFDEDFSKIIKNIEEMTVEDLNDFIEKEAKNNKFKIYYN